MASSKNKIVEEAIVPAAEETTALAQVEDYGEYAADADKLTKDDMLIERYRICQATSNKAKDAGVVEGEIFGTISKKGMKSCLVVAVSEERVIVERLDNSDGTYLGTHQLTDPRIQDAYKRNGNKYIGLKGTTPDGKPTKLIETRNVHVVFLNSEDGVTPEGFGTLNCESVNLTPLALWKQNRTRIKGGAQTPTYAFRTVVSTEPHTNPQGKKSKKFKFDPYNGSWEASRLRPSVAAHKDLLDKCTAHKKLIEAGALTIEYSDADDSEAAQENAAF
jgi:hypothetical protein